MEEEKKEAPVERDVEESKEEGKEEEEVKEEEAKVSRPFDPEQDGKSWDAIDLGSMLMQGNKKRKIPQAVKKFVQVEQSELVRVRNDIKLRLTDDIEFSMTHFSKPNKGFANTQQINCFMNVCLQSLLACPALFNLLQAISSNLEVELSLNDSGLLHKMVHVSKYFDEAHQIDPKSLFAKRVVNSEKIFEPFLRDYNPDNE